MRRALLLLTAALAVATATVGVATARSPEPGSTVNRGKAIADARKRLRAYVPPPGSHRVAGLPKSLRLNSAGSRPASPRYVDVHDYWISSEPVEQVRAYLKTHHPAGARLSSEGESGDRGGIYRWDYGYAWPELPNVADLRELSVGVVARPGGGSALRVDSLALYLEPKPQGQQIPAGVGYLEATESLEGRPPRAVGTASAAKIEAVSKLVDGFEVIQNNGPTECGFIPSERATLKAVFRVAKGGPVLAETEQELPAGYCDFVGLTIEGQKARGLYDEGGALTKSLQHLLARKYKRPLTAGLEGF
jgi:hypothetical protein